MPCLARGILDIIYRNFALFASTRDLLTRYAYMSWYPRFPSIVVEALITLLSFLEEEYLPFLRNIWRGKEELI